MITIQQQNLIISIPCNNSNPLEILGEIQEALHDVVELIDYENGSKEMIANANQKLSLLLKSLAFSPGQLDAINNQALTNTDIKEQFLN